ncbi:MAG TPA: cytochrome c, partial [Acidobacteriaceae bacterium]|nr:cytochrome c [Acidobacteriaceae bacterium]
ISRTVFPAISLAVLLVSAIAQTSRSVWDGVYTAGQAKRGAALYSQECASCHGLTLNGGEMAPALTGGEFLANWNGLTLADLFNRIRQSMPADRPGSLTRDQNADVLAHILSMNQFPAGTTELDKRIDYLNQIRIEASRK